MKLGRSKFLSHNSHPLVPEQDSTTDMPPPDNMYGGAQSRKRKRVDHQFGLPLNDDVLLIIFKVLSEDVQYAKSSFWCLQFVCRQFYNFLNNKSLWSKQDLLNITGRVEHLNRYLSPFHMLRALDRCVSPQDGMLILKRALGTSLKETQRVAQGLKRKRLFNTVLIRMIGKKVYIATIHIFKEFYQQCECPHCHASCFCKFKRFLRNQLTNPQIKLPDDPKHYTRLVQYCTKTGIVLKEDVIQKIINTHFSNHDSIGVLPLGRELFKNNPDVAEKFRQGGSEYTLHVVKDIISASKMWSIIDSLTRLGICYTKEDVTEIICMAKMYGVIRPLFPNRRHSLNTTIRTKLLLDLLSETRESLDYPRFLIRILEREDWGHSVDKIFHYFYTKKTTCMTLEECIRVYKEYFAGNENSGKLSEVWRSFKTVMTKYLYNKEDNRHFAFWRFFKTPTVQNDHVYFFKNYGRYF